MSFFTNLIYEYGLLAIFLIILIEYACFPISSEIVLPFSGAIASLQHINFLTLLFVSVLAGLLGTSFCFFVGRFGGAAVIEQFIRHFPKSKKAIDSSYKKFDKHGGFAVCIGRIIPLCRTYIAFIAGSSHQKFTTFLGASFLGITVWNTILLGLGFLMRENWGLVSGYYSQYKLIFIFSCFVITILIVYRIKQKR